MNKRPGSGTNRTIDIVNAGLARRYRTEHRFQRMGQAAIILSLVFLAILFMSIFINGYSAFQQAYMSIEVYFDPDVIDTADLATSNFPGLVKKSMRKAFPDVGGRRDKRSLYALVSSDAGFQLQRMVAADAGLIGQTLSVWVLAPAIDSIAPA